MSAKSLLRGLAVITAFCLTRGAKADYSQARIASANQVVVSPSGGTWGNAISSSVLTLVNDAGNSTSVLLFDVTPPAIVNGQGVALYRFKVHYRVAVSALDATPTFVERQLSYVSNVNTATTLSDTESGCGTTVNTSYTCLVTLSTPLRVKAGDRVQLEMTVDNSATSLTQITGLEILGLGQ